MADVSMNEWFPDTPYYREHSDRLSKAFGSLPLLGGCRVLCIGSWGDEGRYLEYLGAVEVIAIRAPGEWPCVETRGNVSVYAFDVEGEWPDIGKFDVVLAWEVLEHLNRDPMRMLFEAIKATKIGGLLSITTPNALWHVYTLAQVSGSNALGLQLQPHIPYATHWRLWSPSEVAESLRKMGCEPTVVTTFLREQPQRSLKSRLAVWALERFRRNSGNGVCSVGQHVLVNARKRGDSETVYYPEWLFPKTEGQS